MPEHTWKVCVAVLTFVGFCAGIGFLILMLLGAAGADWKRVAGEWKQYRLNDSQMKWFKSVKSQLGVPCCDISDGHPTEMKRSVSAEGVNEYWIPHPLPTHVGEWLLVPPNAYAIPFTNPIGVTIVWYVSQGVDEINIRCFIPEAET